MIALHLRPEPARRQPRQLHHSVVTGQPTDPGANYRVATNDFAIDGGDSYATFRQGANPAIYSDQLLSDVIVGYSDSSAR